MTNEYNRNGRRDRNEYTAREEYLKNTFVLVGAKGENVEMICLIIILYFYDILF